MSQVLNLYRLQKIVTRRDQNSSRLAEIDKIISEKEDLRHAREQSENANQALQEARRKLKLLEDAVQSQQIKIEENTAALYGGRIHNPKELQDLQNEVAALKRYQATLEDQQLEAMIYLETFEAQSKAAQDYLQAILAQSISINSTLVG